MKKHSKAPQFYNMVQRFKLFKAFLCLPVLILWGLSSVSAFSQEATSQIMGYNATQCLGGSDTFISVPFHRAPIFSGSVAGNVTLNDAEIEVSAEAPGWTPDTFVGSHYAKFTTGAASGLILEISTNSASGITVDPAGYRRHSVKAGDRFLIIPHWTLDTLLPVSQTTLHLSTGHLVPGRGSEIHFYVPNSEGINLSPELIYYVTATGWFQSAKGSPAAGDVIVRPHAAMVVRHKVGAADTLFRPAANVDVNPSQVQLSASQGALRDNVLAIIRPIPVSLKDLGLRSPAFISSVGVAPGKRRDELMIFDNAEIGLNKSESARYFFHSGHWKLDNQTDFPISDDVQLPRGSVVVIRKASATSGKPVAWKNLPKY
ncbi:MAG: TIGR02597 family protein [Verrucomicrobiales bacterium]